jgi:diphthine-ammonia ligase
MHLLALLSGGKDSVTAATLAHVLGHKVVAAATITSQSAQELDSHMFQTVTLDIAAALATQCAQLPHYHKHISKQQTEASSGKALGYDEKEEEIEALFELVKDVISKHPDITGIISGAILSNYQRLRVENVCQRLGLVSFAPLWRIPQKVLLDAMIASGIDAVLVKTAVYGLNPLKVLGKSIRELQSLLIEIGNPCGEGGEYETFVLDSPWFKENKIELNSYSIVGERLESEWDPSGNIQIENFSIVPKPLSSDREVEHLFKTLRSLVSYRPELMQLNPKNCYFASQEFPDFEIGLEPSKEYVLNHTSHSGFEFYVSPSNCSCILEMLDAWNSSVDRDVKEAAAVSLCVPNMKDFGSLNKTYVQYFDQNPPSRCCVEILSSNFYGDCLYIPKSWSKTSLHVQSISSWAPACIGPYSQATQCFQYENFKINFLAGQIPLAPITMQIEADNVEEELQLTLLHSGSIIEALKSPYAESCKSLEALGFDATLLSIVFCTTESFDRVVSSMDIISSALNWIPSLILAVPSLPRNARVETQLITVSSSESLKHSFKCVQKGYPGYMIKSVSICFSDCPFGSYFYMPTNMSKDSPLCLNELLTNLIGSMDLSQDFVIVRVYYVASLFGEPHSFEQLVRNRFSTRMAVSFFPCSGIYFDKTCAPCLIYCMSLD